MGRDLQVCAELTLCEVTWRHHREGALPFLDDSLSLGDKKGLESCFLQFFKE